MSARWRIDVGAVFVYLALGAMFSAVPRHVTESLDGSKAMAGLAVSVFFLAAIITRPLAGRSIDRNGRRPLLATLPFGVALTMLAMLLATSVPAVLALRFAQGVCGGAFYVVAVTAETDLAPPERRASAVARLSIAIYLGFATGPALGEVLTDLGPGWTWSVLAGLAVVGGLLTSTVPETRPVGAAPARVVGVAGDEPVELTGGAGTGGDRVPLVHPVAVLPGLMLLGLGVGYTAITAHSALYAREVGFSSSSVLYATFALTILVVRLGSGRLADRVGAVKVMYPGLVSMAGGLALLAVWPVRGAAVVGVALVGLGWALVFPACTSWVAGEVPDAQRGAAIGTLVAFMDIGQGGGGYLVGAIADAAGFGWAYAVPAVLAASGALALRAAVRQRQRHRVVPAPG